MAARRPRSLRGWVSRLLVLSLLLLLHPHGGAAETDLPARAAAAMALTAPPRAASRPAAVGAPPLLVVGTLDGSLQALSRDTGQLLWSINGGPLLTDGQATRAEADPVAAAAAALFVPDPRDGALYVVERAATAMAGDSAPGLRRLDQSIQQLVHDAPFTADDGAFVYLGAKATRVYSVDQRTGELRSKYLPQTDAADTCAPDAAGDEDSAAPPPLFIGRTEYAPPP